MLEKIFDSNDTIFRYNPALQTFSVIEADFLMKNTVKNTNLFVFLSKGNNDKYFCKSFFPENKTDYAERQTRWTVLLKKNKLRNENNEEKRRKSEEIIDNENFVFAEQSYDFLLLKQNSVSTKL